MSRRPLAGDNGCDHLRSQTRDKHGGSPQTREQRAMLARARTGPVMGTREPPSGLHYRSGRLTWRLDGGGPIEGDIGGLRSRRLGPDVAASPSQAVFNAT